MATNQDRDSLHHPTGTLVPPEDNDEFIAKVTEKVAERVREIILDDDPFRPVDLELLAIRVAQIITNRDDQKLGRQTRGEIKWAARWTFRALVTGGIGAAIAKLIVKFKSGS
jgi:hypothetical protein